MHWLFSTELAGKSTLLSANRYGSSSRASGSWSALACASAS